MNDPTQFEIETQTNFSYKYASNFASSFELELELHIACAILNESLYEPLKADKNKVVSGIKNQIFLISK